jgi:hypothetical protein
MTVSAVNPWRTVLPRDRHCTADWRSLAIIVAAALAAASSAIRQCGRLQRPHQIRASDAALTLAATDSATAASMMAHWALDDVITAAIAAVVGVALWWIGFFALTLF